jgi:hypothetical protein
MPQSRKSRDAVVAHDASMQTDEAARRPRCVAALDDAVRGNQPALAALAAVAHRHAEAASSPCQVPCWQAGYEGCGAQETAILDRRWLSALVVDRCGEPPVRRRMLRGMHSSGKSVLGVAVSCEPQGRRV